MTFARRFYTDTESRPLLTDNAAHILSCADLVSYGTPPKRPTSAPTGRVVGVPCRVYARKKPVRTNGADMNFQARTLTVHCTKNHASRTLPMGPYLAAMLNSRERLGPLVFTGTHR